MGGTGLRIYRLTAKGPQLVTETPLDNGSGNPAIYQGKVYACGSRKIEPPAPLGPQPGTEPDEQVDAIAPADARHVEAARPISVGVMVCADAVTGKVLWETAGADLALGGGQWSYASPMVGSGVVCVLSNRLLLFSATDGKRLGNPALQIPVHRCTSLAIAGEFLVARGRNGVVCYNAVKP
jgi:hypothetical protein